MTLSKVPFVETNIDDDANQRQLSFSAAFSNNKSCQLRKAIRPLWSVSISTVCPYLSLSVQGHVSTRTTCVIHHVGKESLRHAILES